MLPVKGGPLAKSRLGAPPRVAAAIALDTLAAASAAASVGRVVVVTADPTSAAAARAGGAEVVPESRTGEGLVAAVRDGVAAAGRRRPWSARPAAVLLADLPALCPEDLQAALAAAASALAGDPGAAMAAVPDTEGTGTVLLAARTPADLDPAFGADRSPSTSGAAPCPWTSTCRACAATSTPRQTSRPPWPSAWGTGRPPPWRSRRQPRAAGSPAV